MSYVSKIIDRLKVWDQTAVDSLMYVGTAVLTQLGHMSHPQVTKLPLWKICILQKLKWRNFTLLDLEENKHFLATLVALDFTLVSESVGHSFKLA